MRMLVSRLLRFAARVIVCGVLVAGKPPDRQASGQPQSYETAFYPSGKFKIEAYVYKPEGTGPFPVVIYNHGSRAGHEREERPFVYVGEMLTHSGYVVIVPERRGYGKSDGPTFGESIEEARGPRFVARVQEETEDVLAVEEFVKALPFADAKRMAVMGWSIGGIVSVFAASQSSAFRGVVDQAGGALTWDQSHAMQQALKQAAGQVRIPLLGMVAKNDRTTESVKAVMHEAEAHGATAKLIVYPAFTPRDAGGVSPGQMIFGRDGWKIWEGDLLEFLSKYLTKIALTRKRREERSRGVGPDLTVSQVPINRNFTRAFWILLPIQVRKVLASFALDLTRLAELLQLLLCALADRLA